MAGRLPECIALRLDPSTRRSQDGRTLVGGSPIRLVRFTAPGAEALDRLLARPDRGPTDPTEAAVARKLLDADMAQPVPDADVATPKAALVVPVKDDAAGLRRLLDAGPVPAGSEVVVVDDGSARPEAVEQVCAGRARLIRHDRARGPAAARNTGWRATAAEVVVFVDADVVPADGWFVRLARHLADPAVGVVAPRVRSDPGRTDLLGRYEAARSPLDLGPRSGRVAPGARVSYVPSAAVVCRREVLEALDGFDESQRVGEDVDLVWRAVDAGWTVRYDAGVEVFHRVRSGWRAAFEQRRAYGSAAAALDERHPGRVAPVVCNVWTLVAWALAALGGRLGVAAGLATTGVTTAALVPRLRGRVDDPEREAVRLAAGGTLATGVWIGNAVWRAWLPAALVASVASRRARRATVLAAVAPGLLGWRRARPAVDPARFVLVGAADDAAYAIGVWQGSLRRRSWGALAPRLSGITGVTDRVRSTRERSERSGSGRRGG